MAVQCSCGLCLSDANRQESEQGTNKRDFCSGVNHSVRQVLGFNGLGDHSANATELQCCGIAMLCANRPSRLAESLPKLQHTPCLYPPDTKSSNSPAAFTASIRSPNAKRFI